MRSQWRLVEEKNGIAFIEDLDGPVSVTNDAERVFMEVMALTPRAYSDRPTRVVYRDTEGEWWEIVYANLAASFRPWHGMVWDTLSN